MFEKTEEHAAQVAEQAAHKAVADAIAQFKALLDLVANGYEVSVTLRKK